MRQSGGMEGSNPPWGPVRRRLMARPVTDVGTTRNQRPRSPGAHGCSGRRPRCSRSAPSVTSVARPRTSTLHPVSTSASAPSTSKATLAPPASPSSIAVAPVRNTIVCPSTAWFTGRTIASPSRTKPTRPIRSAASSFQHTSTSRSSTRHVRSDRFIAVEDAGGGVGPTLETHGGLRSASLSLRSSSATDGRLGQGRTQPRSRTNGTVRSSVGRPPGEGRSTLPRAKSGADAGGTPRGRRYPADERAEQVTNPARRATRMARPSRLGAHSSTSTAARSSGCWAPRPSAGWRSARAGRPSCCR